MQRRHLLRAVAVGPALAVAGCVGGGNEDGSGVNNTDAPPETEDQESEEDSTADPPTESADSTDQPDDGDETQDEEENTGDETQDEADEETAGPTLGDFEVAFENNYRFSVSVPQLGEPVTGAFSDGNFYSVVAVEGDTVTTYLVDGQQYVVADGTCTPVPSGTSGGLDVPSLADADTVEADITDPESASLTPSGTTTIDGAEMYVYVLGSQTASATYYVSVENRRLRRVQTEGTTIDYTDWGSVDPITAPC